ncbi:hypothetical protein ACTL6U_03205 [Rhodovibrionaceae bacterium A322]
MALVSATPTALAGEVEIVAVKAVPGLSDRWDFHVTLRHDDEGWNHYANIWQVLDGQGNILGERVLYHPHVNEQPFTRSLNGVAIPLDLSEVTVRAGALPHGWSEKTQQVPLRANR